MKTMKSKSFDLTEGPAEKTNHNKSYDFVNLYVSAAETKAKLLEKRKSDACVNKESNFGSKTSTSTPKRERSPYKKKKKSKNEPVDISLINIDGRSLNASLNNITGRSSPVNLCAATSTPSAGGKRHGQGSKVKSIMKTSSNDDAMDANLDESTPKSKKRNKSVSFMLDDNEEVAIKKTKSNDCLTVDKKSKNRKDDIKKNLKKLKKNMQAEKENKGNENMDTDQNASQKVEKKSKTNVEKTKSPVIDASADSPAPDSQNQVPEDKKKKLKKIKKHKKMDDSSEPIETESNNNEPTEHKVKKLKKKKRHSKSLQGTDTTETEGEPAIKARKKEAKADIITEDLENLSIGDNAHTLSNLLDEMTVVDKDKKKKNKHRRKKEKTQNTASISSSETADLEKIEEGKEKVKWKKRKWNKDKKGDIEEDLITSVIVENLPLKIMLSYKKLLSDHFGKLGLIKRIGIAEVYPTEEPKPVFTTTITFYSEGAATKALEEDNVSLEGGRIRVKRPLPPTLTTMVVRSYGELTEQALSSVFTSAGRMRSIRHLVKGRKSMATAFIEFDGPEAVDKAIKMAEDAKIGGKKIHVSKFELRVPRHMQKKAKNNAESENEGDSEDSND